MSDTLIEADVRWCTEHHGVVEPDAERCDNHDLLDCEPCDGVGMIDDDDCEVCDGHGTLPCVVVPLYRKADTVERPFTVETYTVKRWTDDKSYELDHRWRARGRNGEIIASGEGYTSKANRDHVIELMWPGIDTEEVDG